MFADIFRKNHSILTDGMGKLYKEPIVQKKRNFI